MLGFHQADKTKNKDKTSIKTICKFSNKLETATKRQLSV